MSNRHPFTSGELILHHRGGGAGSPITCGARSGCVTAVAADVACPSCREVLDRRHAGLGLPCDQCEGPCQIDELAVGGTNG